MAAIFSEEAFHRFAAALTQTEVLPRPTLDLYQGSLLQRLAAFAFKSSAFYSERLKPLFRNGDVPDLRFWRDVPILKRRDLEAEIDRINPAEVPNDIGAVTTRRTSGTTGAGLEFRTCDIARLAAEGMMHRHFRWRGLDLRAPLASIRYYSSGRRNYPDGITEPFWCYAHPAPHYTLDYKAAVSDMIEWLERRRPKYLLTFPSIAHDIAAHPRAEAVAALGLQAIVGISELVSPDTAIDVRDALRCDIASIYACAEMGCIALQSHMEREFEICEETVYVEVLDADDNPVGPGETGRVILTSLYNYATPFIRYEIGDYAILSERPNAAGRTLRKLQRVTGRGRNALVTRDGRRLWDDAVITPFVRQQFPTHMFGIRQFDVETIEISYVADGANAFKPDQEILADYFARLLGGPVRLTLNAVAELARSSGGKRERIVSTAAVSNSPA